MLLNGVAMATSSRRLLDLLRTRGTLSRVELATLSGLTSPTVSNVVRGLADLGLVHEVGVRHGGRGQPRRLLRVTPTAGYAVGVQVDLTTTTIVVVDFAGTTVARAGLHGSGRRSPDRTVAAVAEHVDRLLTGSAVPRERVLGVGLVTHGPQDRERGMLVTPQPTPEWREYPLTARLSARLGLPVVLENDATAAAVGELWTSDLDTTTFGLVYMASGVGGAVVVDGVAYRGRDSNAAEIGHVPLPGSTAPCVCGKHGCAQADAAPAAVVAEALNLPGAAPRWSLRGDDDHTLADFAALARAGRAGDEDATALLRRSARRLGQATTVLVDLFDLDTVLLAGTAFAAAGPLYRDVIADELAQHTLSRTIRVPRVEMARQVETAAAVGGALHLLRSTPGAVPAVPVGASTAPHPVVPTRTPPIGAP